MSMKRSLVYLVLLVFAGLSLYPAVWMGLTSLRTNRELFAAPWGLPERLLWGNYVRIFHQSPILRYFLNSLVVSSTSTFLILIVSSMLAYPLARFKFRGRNFLFYLIIAGLALPAHISLIPILVLLKGIHLNDTYLALIGPYVGFGLPFSVLVIRSFFLTIPRDFEDAAKLDGCSAHGIFWKILLPMIKPALAVVVIFNFMTNWNEFLFALTFIQRRQLKTLPVGLMDFAGEFATDWVGVSAGFTIATIPVIVIYCIFQKDLLRAVRFGAIKG